MNIKPLALACAALVAVAAMPAHAAFTGAFDPSQWTTTSSNGGNGTAAMSTDKSTLTLTSSDFEPFTSFVASTVDYSITLAQDTTIKFDWSYTTADDSSTQDPFGYALGGTKVQLSVDGVSGYDPAQTGSVTLVGHKGQVFSFEASSVDSVFGASTTSINGFSAIPAVPEPASVLLMLAGMGALAGMARRRRNG